MWSLRPKVDSPEVASPVQTTPYNTAYKRCFLLGLFCRHY